MRAPMMTLTILAAWTGTVFAATHPGSISREPLMAGSVSERLTVGVGYMDIERGINPDRSPDTTLEARVVSGYVGYDVLPWLTAFVTAGGAELERENSVKADAGLKLSGGVHAYLWEADVYRPAFAAGRISVKAVAEISRYASAIGAQDVDWLDFSVALPLGYEFFDRNPVQSSGISTSLSLYAGPAFSYWDGTIEDALGDVGFTAEDTLGFVAGLDVFFSQHLALGVQVLVFDEATYGASTRFRF